MPSLVVFGLNSLFPQRPRLMAVTVAARTLANGASQLSKSRATCTRGSCSPLLKELLALVRARMLTLNI